MRFLIIGSSFAGSIMAAALARAGHDCTLIDRQAHPRFAIGESSTPIADFLLAYIGRKWDLPELQPLASWGKWQAKIPQIRGGKKRGFTYFDHVENKPSEFSNPDTNCLLVAASNTDEWSDTHWLRSDVDRYLFETAEKSGVRTLERHNILGAIFHGSQWLVEFQPIPTDDDDSTRASFERRFDFVIDSSGRSNVLGRWTGNRQQDDWMKCQRAAIFGHFSNINSMIGSELLTQLPANCFHPDDSAQHHIAGDSWMWQLRFNHGLTSVGWSIPTSKFQNCFNNRGMEPDDFWQIQNAKFPTIKSMLANAERDTDSESSLRLMPRVSHCLESAAGAGWACLPSTLGIVDPLHSTGIAHTLWGVNHLLTHLTAELIPEKTSENFQQALIGYSDQLKREIRWIDRLVFECYRQLRSFRRFRAATCLYFICAIQMEKQLSLESDLSSFEFLSADECKLQKMVSKIESTHDSCSDQEYEETVRQAISPWNDVGLLDGFYVAHSAAPKFHQIG